MKSFISTLFFGNFFYGICAVALCIESIIQHQLPTHYWLLYLFIFTASVLFYTRVYYKSTNPLSKNERTIWYNTHYNFVTKALVTECIVLVFTMAGLVYQLWLNFAALQLVHWLLLAIFPVVAFLYTFKTIPFFKNRQLRTIGWLKPFCIGFVWSGVVTFYPVLFAPLQQGKNDVLQLPSIYFFLNNFLFITVLAIIFDIKDVDSDRKFRLNTYPALVGARKTIQYIIVPLTLLSAAMLTLHLFNQQAPAIDFLLQAVPFLMLLVSVSAVKQQRSIIFYLAVIDGLMLVKASFGIISNLYF